MFLVQGQIQILEGSGSAFNRAGSKEKREGQIEVIFGKVSGMARRERL